MILDETALIALVRRAVREELEAQRGIGLAPPEWLTPERLAEQTGIPVRTWRDHVRTGRLRGRRAGRRWLIARADLDAFLAAGTRTKVVDIEAAAQQVIARAGRRRW